MKGGLIPMICLLILSGCGKNAGSATKELSPQVGKSLWGYWELRDLQGGFRQPRSDKDYIPGNGNAWQFQDSAYQQFLNGSVVGEGQYSHIRDSAAATGRIMDGIVIRSGEIEREIFYEFKQDTLVLYEGHIAWDGTISKYVRITGSLK